MSQSQANNGKYLTLQKKIILDQVRKLGIYGVLKRQTEEEVGRQYQRVDRNGLCQLN